MAMSRVLKAVIGCAVALLIAAGIAVGIYFGLKSGAKDTTGASQAPAAAATTPIPPSADKGLRVDCLVDQLVKTKLECERRKCAWDDGDNVEDGDKCSITKSPFTGYTVTKVDTAVDGTMVIDLYYKGEVASLFSQPEDVIRNVRVQITPSGEDTLRITFTDAEDDQRYRVPIPLTLQPAQNASLLYSYTVGSVDDKFFVKVTRQPEDTVIFDTKWADIIMEKQFLSLSTLAPTGNVYGLGENSHRHFKHQFNKTDTWAMFARDQGPAQNESLPVQYDNLYGVHPFHVCIEENGKAHGIFHLNSNAQDVTLTTGHMITYRTIGGILDFFVFLGPTPENVVQQYTRLVGRPYMPPYWSLGFQLCRYGYKNTKDIEAAVNRTRAAQIPHDVQYADIDYMDGRKDFTIDRVNFGGMADYFKQLQEKENMKIIIILDPAISIESNYSIYPEGKTQDIYIKWPTDKSTAICEGCTDDMNNMFGYVWPDNKTAFPDFFKNRTKAMWKEWIVNQRAEIRFDGLWIDMNEPASFDTNNDQPWNWDDQRPGEPAWNLICDMSNKLENPPYKTKACSINIGELRNISDKTLCMVGVQGENNEYKHYDVHNLYGWSQTEPTLMALREAIGSNKRGMVITRSTFAGSGKHAGHWLGDNTANWQHLRDSIVGMLEFNLFGIPYVGADICGFFLNSTAPLCKRWMQLGAFYPFSRNHNGITSTDQDPAAFPEDPQVAELSRTSLETRYSLLPYLYTLFYRANADGSTVVRSLQFEWPTDPKTLDISEQFLWGSSILFSPILYQGQQTVNAYLPAGNWYDYYTYNEVETTGRNTTDILVTESSEIPIHLRGGSIIPTKSSALTTYASRLTAFKLLVALDSEGEASGELFWDDGETIDTIGSSCLISFIAANQLVKSTVHAGNCVADADSADSMSIKIGMVHVMGINGPVTNVTIDDSPVSNFTVTGNALEINTSLLITNVFQIRWS